MAIPRSALKDLVKLPVAAKWRRLGLQLGVPLHKLNDIQANHENSRDFVQECLIDMFDWWLNNDDDPTYERLSRGIRGIGERKLVTCFLQQRSHVEVYSELAQALNRIGEGDLAGEMRILLCIQCSNCGTTELYIINILRPDQLNVLLLELA